MEVLDSRFEKKVDESEFDKGPDSRTKDEEGEEQLCEAVTERRGVMHRSPTEEENERRKTFGVAGNVDHRSVVSRR